MADLLGYPESPESVSGVSTVPVLLPLPIDTTYDYLPPEGPPLEPGEFVLVPIGPRKEIGVVWERDAAARPVDPKKLKRIVERFELPPLPATARRFADWVARYTLSPRGMVLKMMMSANDVFSPDTPRWGFKLAGPPPSRLTPGRQRAIEAAEDGLIWPKAALAERAGVSYGVIDGLAEAGTFLRVELPRAKLPRPKADFAPPDLSEAQAYAAHALRERIAAGGYSVSLIDGVTGSGKTEVYFEAVAEAIRQGRQALILLPEIALTNQFLQRFEARFGCRPQEWHSAIGPGERARVWRAVAEGEAKVVAGARSALFLPFADLGLIVVDEEHDSAFKQEDRVSYQGRDMAVLRASLSGASVVLSSATPSLESVVNAQQGRYAHLILPQRFAGAQMPELSAIDLRKTPPERGRWLSPPLVQATIETLERGQQTLLFLNRRGYAPLTLCRTCGHRIECPQCSATLVEHRFRQQLTCHHCGFTLPLPKTCPKCSSEGSLVPCGPGVERVAEEVAERFPGIETAILSSDLVPGLRALREIIEKIARGDAKIIIGTQLVAKGHHFPHLATVGVVDGDLSLANGDPRAAERTFQLLSQVTGRAGREDGVKGRGLIQTHLPEHPVMQAIIASDRDSFIAQEIEARREAAMPPFGRLAALVISAKVKPEAEHYARKLVLAAPRSAKISVLGPAEAPLALIRGRHRYRLLVKASRDADLQAYLRHWLDGAPPAKGSLRLAVDVDPYSFL
ncbi:MULTISPECIES: primosomal protein N' [Rhodomicrobium]|uniref:primosomal protein N' n=1 Tax=Rhodomicrobium TaxID=1068 RepID=UPI000B4B6A9E|nr:MULTISPECIES: primosomal protein N' [Rhodomicrobium]